MDTDLVILPDAERMVSSFLRAQPEMASFANRIFTELPTGTKSFPLMRLTRFGGIPAFSRPVWLDVAILQIDVWADQKVQARLLAETARACIYQRLPGVHDEGVCTAVIMSTLSFSPDQVFTDPGKRSAKARYRFDCSVYAHPGSTLDGSPVEVP